MDLLLALAAGCLLACAPSLPFRCSHLLYSHLHPHLCSHLCPQARHYLNDEGHDCSFVPEFDKTEDGLNVLNLFVMKHPVGAAV